MKMRFKYAAAFLLPIVLSAATAEAVEFNFDVKASNARFSKEYEPYYPMITADTRTTEEIYNYISPRDHELTPAQKETRMKMIEMYQKVGFDISRGWESGKFGATNPQDARLRADRPSTWSTETPKPLEGRYEQPFSIDACWNNEIPYDFPRVEMPREVFSFEGLMIATVSSNLQTGGNGTGIPIIIGYKDDETKLMVDMERGNGIRKLFEFVMPADVTDRINKNTASDQHALFIDDEKKVCIQSWITMAENSWRSPDLANGPIPGYNMRAWCTSNLVRLDGIGNEGRAGVYAAQAATLGFTIKDWEITEPDAEINHAISGAFNPLCNGFIYPAARSDAGDAGLNNPGNCGSLIQGGILQLDPDFDLKSVYDSGKLSLPAYKILKAMQKYGMYNLDKGGNSANHGCMMYTSTGASDWLNPEDSRYNVPFKDGAQGAVNVTDEIKAFFRNDEFFALSEQPKLFITIPNVKYAILDVNGDGVIDKTDEAIVTANVDKEITEENEICDINQDGKLTGRDAEIYYNYFNDQGQHSYIYYNINYLDVDNSKGMIVSAAEWISRSQGNTFQVQEGMDVTFGAIPAVGYEFECWTGDFEGITSRTLTLHMDKDYNFGAKFKKAENTHAFKVNIEGPGTVGVQTRVLYNTGEVAEYKEPATEYAHDELLSIQAQPEVGAKFIGWKGSVSGVNNTLSYVVKEETEITAVFSDEGYMENYNAEEWESANGNFGVTFTPDSKRITFGFSNFQKPSVIYNKNSYVDDGYTFSVRFNCSTPMRSDANGARMLFNYQDSKNYYYIQVGGAGGVTLGKVYKGTNSKLRTYVKSKEVDGVTFDNWPLDIKVTRTADGRMTVEGFRENKCLVYFENVKDNTFKGGKIGLASANHGYLRLENIVLNEISETDEGENTNAVLKTEE